MSSLLAKDIIYFFPAYWAFISYIFYEYLANPVFIGTKFWPENRQSYD
jgi:hypothetical protein